MQTLEEQIQELKTRILEHDKGIQADQIIRSIAINSPSNIMVLDLDARIQYINHTVPGITPEEMVGLCLPEIVDEEFRPSIRGALERVAKSGEADRYETCYTSPSGDVSWWDSGVGPILQDSKVTGYVVVSTNTTEQRRNREEQERFFNLSVDLMCVANFDGYFTRVNQAFKTATGYREELLKRPFLEFFHPDDLKATQEAVARLAAGDVVRDFTNRCVTATGTYRLISWRAVSDHNREVIYGVGRDITEAKNLEEQLQQSRKMEAVGQLAGGIAHDFNNLLTAIQGNIDLAQLEPASADIFLKDAMEATIKAATLTKQLLVFSRYKTYSPAVLDLNPLLDNLMSLLKRLLPESIAITLHHTPDAPAIFADQSQLEQVVINLCVNARDAMPAGGCLTLGVKALRTVENTTNYSNVSAGEYLILSITDTGCGMTHDVQQRIFEPFFTTKEVGKGTGLGLATVYGIVQKHQGYIEVDSKLGQGTTFQVYLPTTTQSLPLAPFAAKSSTSVTGGNETILVVEDDSMVRTTVTHILKQAGYTVLTATDGQEAVHQFRIYAEQIALVLLDVVMPNMGGLAAADLLRQHRANIKVIFASGHVPNPQDQKRLETETFLPKPYQRENLLSCIRKMLDIKNENSG